MGGSSTQFFTYTSGLTHAIVFGFWISLFIVDAVKVIAWILTAVIHKIFPLIIYLFFFLLLLSILEILSGKELVDLWILSKLKVSQFCDKKFINARIVFQNFQ
jgi:hypothetical protein